MQYKNIDEHPYMEFGDQFSFSEFIKRMYTLIIFFPTE